MLPFVAVNSEFQRKEGRIFLDSIIVFRSANLSLEENEALRFFLKGEDLSLFLKQRGRGGERGFAVFFSLKICVE